MSSSRNPRVSAAMADPPTENVDVDVTREPTQPKPTKKRSTPTPSPEFAQARIKRDLRVLHEREVSLCSTHSAKLHDIATKREALMGELAAVETMLSALAGKEGKS